MGWFNYIFLLEYSFLFQISGHLPFSCQCSFRGKGWYLLPVWAFPNPRMFQELWATLNHDDKLSRYDGFMKALSVSIFFVDSVGDSSYRLILEPMLWFRIGCLVIVCLSVSHSLGTHRLSYSGGVHSRPRTIQFKTREKTQHHQWSTIPGPIVLSKLNNILVRSKYRFNFISPIPEALHLHTSLIVKWYTFPQTTTPRHKGEIHPMTTRS